MRLLQRLVQVLQIEEGQKQYMPNNACPKTRVTGIIL